jgi:hypothetical protein
MKNTVSLNVSFFARNRKQFRLINETENHFVNRFVTMKQNETRSKRISLTPHMVGNEIKNDISFVRWQIYV